MPSLKPNPIPEMTQRDTARFWKHVNKNGPVPAHRPELGPCWLWTLKPAPDGYGMFGLWPPLRGYKAHRVAYKLHYGYDPGVWMVCHHCDVKLCCRPEHIFLGDQAVNIADAKKKGRMATGNRHWTKAHPEKLPRGADHWHARGSNPEAKEMRELYADGMPTVDLAVKFNVSRGFVYSVLTGKRFPDAGGPIFQKTKEIPPDIRAAIRADHATGMGYRRLQRKYGYSRAGIGSICTGRTQKDSCLSIHGAGDNEAK